MSRRSRSGGTGGKNKKQSPLSQLPEIDEIKSAIVRWRVKSGISYLLPYDKTAASVRNVFRQDLRALFQDPYSKMEADVYDEQYVHSSASHHFAPNTIPAIFRPQPIHFSDYRLNYQSEQVRRQYANSAPPHGITGKLTSVDLPELQPRSTLYLPIKTKLQPEAERIKEEAERILESVKQSVEAEYDTTNKPPENELPPVKPKREKKKHKKKTKIAFGSESESDLPESRIKRKTIKNENYEEFKKFKPPAKPPFPESLESPFLSDEKTKLIWDWMTWDDNEDEFSYFISVCK